MGHLSGVLGQLEDLVKAGGPYIGPRGGKWADPEHTIAWDEKVHGAQAKQGSLFGEGEAGKKTASAERPAAGVVDADFLATAPEGTRLKTPTGMVVERRGGKWVSASFGTEVKEMESRGGWKVEKPVVQAEPAPEKPAASVPEGGMTLRLSIEKAKGYSGKKAGRSYFAQITGKDPKFGMKREFLEASEVDWGDSELYRKAKGTWTEHHDLGPGLYERQEYGERKYLMVYFHKEKGKLQWRDVNDDRVKAIAALLDEGVDFEEARLQTKPVKKSLPALSSLEDLLEKGGPYIGPRGGKWADPAHTIAWDEKVHGMQAGQGEEGTRLPTPDEEDEFWSPENQAKHEAAVRRRMAEDEKKRGNPPLRMRAVPPKDPEAESSAKKSFPSLSALAELTKSKPIPLPKSGKAASIASMRAAQGVDSQGNAKKSEEIPGGLAAGKAPEDFDAGALKQGVKVEMEHTDDPKVAREIAMDHLTEDPAYYTKLARMEGGEPAAKPKKKETVMQKALDALATLTGSDPLEKGWNEQSTVYDRWGEYDFNAGKIIQTARDWAGSFWCSRPVGAALRARAFRVAERLADLAGAWAALKEQERAAKPDYENETPAQRDARHEQEKARWEALRSQQKPLVQEARECDRELLRIRSLEAQQEAGAPVDQGEAGKAMPAWDDLRKSFYESKDVLEWVTRYWGEPKHQAKAAELARKLLAYRQKRNTAEGPVKTASPPSKPDEEDKIIREMHALEIEFLESEKKKAEKRAKVEAASKGLQPEDYRLTPGVDCTKQPQLAVAHAQAVVDSRVRALRDQAIQVGRPGPAPTSLLVKGEGGQFVRVGQSAVLAGGQSDQQASRLVDAGRLGAPAEEIPIDRAAGTRVVTCPACHGALLKALTVCPHCGVDQQPSRAPRVASAVRPVLAVQDGQPRLRPAAEETVTLADLQNGRGNG